MIVESTDQKIDPVGSCVGQKGVRIKSIMEELNGERIDIIQNPSSQEKLIRETLSPAEIKYIDLNEEDGILNIFVTEDQRPLAIGKRGQNVRLASKLLELEVNIKNFEDLDPEKQKEVLSKEEAKATESSNDEDGHEESPEVEDIHELELDQETMDALIEANLTQIVQLKGLSVKDLSTIEGISEESAQAIYDKLSQ